MQHSFPGYEGLFGAERLGNGAVYSAESYRVWHAHRICPTLGVQPWTSDKSVVACVNQGRWLALCTSCGEGMLTRPDWGIACCAQCGAVYNESLVVFPEDASEISQILCLRPERNSQNWLLPETVADLHDENVAHGIGV